MPATYEPIATTTLGSDQASISFSSFAGYTDVILVASSRSTHSANGPITIRFNGDTGSNYSYTRLYGSGSAAASDRFSNATSIDFGFLPGTNSTSGVFGISTVHIQNYANSTTNKTVLNRWNTEGSVTAYTAAVVGLWRNTAAITSMSIAYTTGNILTGSTFTLYGVKSA